MNVQAHKNHTFMNVQADKNHTFMNVQADKNHTFMSVQAASCRTKPTSKAKVNAPPSGNVVASRRPDGAKSAARVTHSRPQLPSWGFANL